MVAIDPLRTEIVRSSIGGESQFGRLLAMLGFKVGKTIRGSTVHEWTAAVLKRPKASAAENSSFQLVESPGYLRFLRFLYFEQVSFMDFASIDAHNTFAEQSVVGWHLLRVFRDHCLAVAIRL